MVHLGLPRPDVVRGAAALEIGLLRGPVPAPGFDGLRKALAAERAGPPEHRPRAKRRLKDVDWELAADLLDRLDVVFRDFPGPDGAGDCDLVTTATGHREACDRLIAGPEDASPAETDGSLSCLDALFDDLEMAEPGLMPGRFDDYATFFTSLARERKVACSGEAPHPRLRILGLLEARLLSVDRVVLGGLDEGVWPVRTLTDSFLNRPMRERVGLNPPERRIGQMAHDFVQALGCRDAVITRALKREGAPTVPSRLIQRLRALSGDARWDARPARGAPDHGPRRAARRGAAGAAAEAPRAEAGPGPVPALAQRHRDRDAGARSLQHLRPPRSRARSPRSPGGGAGRRHPRLPGARRLRGVRRTPPGGPAAGRGGASAEPRGERLRRDRGGVPEPLRRVVAALRAHGLGLPRLGGAAPARPDPGLLRRSPGAG